MGPKKVSGKGGVVKKKLSLEKKREIIELYEQGMRVTDLARHYGRSTSTICTVLKQKDTIKGLTPAKGVSIISRLRTSLHEQMETLLMEWVAEKQLEGDTLTQGAICDKALAIYGDLLMMTPRTSSAEASFKASRGWYDNFRKRNGLDPAVRHGEAPTSYLTAFQDYLKTFSETPSARSCRLRPPEEDQTQVADGKHGQGLQSPSVNTVSHIASLSLDSKLAILHELDNDRTELFVSQLFNVPKKVVRQIRLEGDEIRAMALGRKAPSSPDTRLERLEEILSKWIMSNLPNDFRMSSVFVRQLAQNMYKSMAEAVGNDPDVFRASKEWLWQFVRRYGLDCLTWVEEDTVNVTSSSSSCSVDQLMADARGEEMPKVDVDQDAKLIASVEQNRCLYDPEDLDYKNDVMKENVWQKIAKSIDTTVEKAKARWQNLELLYQKSLNSVNKIHMFGKMSFLRPHLNLETREDLKPSEERSPISIKAECISSDDEEFADTVEATPSNMGAVGLIMVDPYRKSRVPLVTYENQHERSLPEDLDMKVEEEIEEEEEEEEAEEENSDMHGEPQNSTSCNSSLCHIPPSDTSFIEAKLQEVSASMAKKRKYTKKLLKSEAPKPDQDLEYFKGFMSMIKELTAKRKRQLFASFAQELFRLLEEQEREESESTET